MSVELGIMSYTMPEDEHAAFKARAALQYGVEEVTTDPNCWVVDPTKDEETAFKASLALGAIAGMANDIINSQGREDILRMGLIGPDEERPNAMFLFSDHFTQEEVGPVREVLVEAVNDKLNKLQSPYIL